LSGEREHVELLDAWVARPAGGGAWMQGRRGGGGHGVCTLAKQNKNGETRRAAFRLMFFWFVLGAFAHAQ
jgi:hypothetical protein